MHSSTGTSNGDLNAEVVDVVVVDVVVVVDFVVVVVIVHGSNLIKRQMRVWGVTTLQKHKARRCEDWCCCLCVWVWQCQTSRFTKQERQSR